jgi:single-stranded-DNA-specific exonuclease
MAEGANLGLLDVLERAGPFGAGHSQPLFVLPRHDIVRVRPVGVGHLRVDLKSGGGGGLQAMAFRCAETELGNFLLGHQGRTVHVAGSIAANYWNGSKSVQFRLMDAALAG